MIKRYSEPLEIDKGEVARYLGYGNQTPDEVVSKLILEKISQFECDKKVCFMPLEVAENDGETVNLGCFSIKSRDFSKFVGENKKIIVFGATIGIEFDRALKRELVLSPGKATILQAVGTAAIEALCDLFCEEFCTRARFSPGYGDLDISAQKEIFKVLNLEKNIGVSLTESLLMTPTKSVTAFLIPEKEEFAGCDSCSKRETCTFKKGLIDK